MRYVYVFGDPEDLSKPCKIGVAKDPQHRLKAVQTGCPYKLDLIWSFPGEESHERFLHDWFSDVNTQGEWFLLTPQDVLTIKEWSEWLPQTNFIELAPAHPFDHMRFMRRYIKFWAYVFVLFMVFMIVLSL